MNKSFQYIVLSLILILVVGAGSLGLYVALRGSSAETPDANIAVTREYETVTLPNYGISFELPKDYAACEQYDPNGPITSPLVTFTSDDLAYIRRDDSCNFTGDAPDFQLHLQRESSESLQAVLMDEKNSYFSPEANQENTKDETMTVNDRTILVSVFSSHDTLNNTQIAAVTQVGKYQFSVVGFGFLDNFPGDTNVVERLLGSITVPEGGISVPGVNQ